MIADEKNTDVPLELDDKMTQYASCAADKKMQSLSSIVDEGILEEALDEAECEHVFVVTREKPVSDALIATCLSKIPPVGDEAPEVTKLRIELDEQLSKLKAACHGIRKAVSQNGFDISDVEMKQIWMQAIDLVESCGVTDSMEACGTNDEASRAGSEAREE